MNFLNNDEFFIIFKNEKAIGEHLCITAIIDKIKH